MARLEQGALQYLSPFDVYDQLTPLNPIPACNVFALASGVFISNHDNPRPLVVLEVGGATHYNAGAILPELRSVMLIGRAIVSETECFGVLGVSKSGSAAISVVRRNGCNNFELVANQDIEVSPSWMTFPVRSTEDVARNSGEVLMNYVRDDIAEFCHYDGQRVFCFSYSTSESTLSVSTFSSVL